MKKYIYVKLFGWKPNHHMFCIAAYLKKRVTYGAKNKKYLYNYELKYE